MRAGDSDDSDVYNDDSIDSKMSIDEISEDETLLTYELNILSKSDELFDNNSQDPQQPKFDEITKRFRAIEENIMLGENKNK